MNARHASSMMRTRSRSLWPSRARLARAITGLAVAQILLSVLVVSAPIENGAPLTSDATTEIVAGAPTHAAGIPGRPVHGGQVPTVDDVGAASSPFRPDNSRPVDVRPQSLQQSPVLERFGPTTGTQVEITNATAWHAAGIDGNGVRIGVIDFFEVSQSLGYWSVAEHGPVPVAGVTARCFDRGRDCTDELFDGVDEGGEDHGVAVVETIRDMAPGVEILIGQATTVADYRALVEWFADRGVDIINRSLGSRFDGPGDGRGQLDDVVAEAVADGILWVNSAGNNSDNKYYRHAARLVNNRVAFGPSGTNTFLRFSGCIALAGIRWANDWDKPAAQRTDFDAYLWESPFGDPGAGSIVDRSTHAQRSGAVPIEDLIDDRCPSAGMALYLELRWRGGGIDGDVIEILDYSSGIAAFTQSEYSAAVSVVDATSSGVLAVGAIDPAASETVGTFSSRGPTNDGRIAPAIVAPSGFKTEAVGWFGGTSAAAAVVAGGAALIKQAGLAADPESLGDLIRHLAIDRGDVGPDNSYGHGEFRLPTPGPREVDATPSRFVALDAPTRLLDTRTDTAIGPTDLIGEVGRGEILDLPITGVGVIPHSGVTAVVANIITVEPDRASYVQALPTGRAELGGFSNLNADAAGQTRANLAIVPLGADGTVSIYSTATGHVVVDVLGWFEATSGPVAAGRFVELPTAQRLIDTRVDRSAGPLGSNDVLSVPMPTGVDLAHVAGLVVTVTSTEATDPGWLQAFPASEPNSIGRTSTVNITIGSSVANTAIVPTDSAGISITGMFTNGGSSHVVVDAIGYITSPLAPSMGEGRFVAVSPDRAFDSRTSGPPLGDGQVVVIDVADAAGVSVPGDASAVVWNMAIVDATRAGYGRGWPADRSEPPTSSLNWTLPGEIRASAAITAVDNGRVRYRIEDGTVNLPGPVGDLIADVFGYFT